MRQRVVVTGVGCVSSLGTGLEAFVEGLLAGRSGIAPVTAFSTEGCRSHTAALLPDFDPARFIDPLKLRRVDEVGRLALATCRLALENSGLPTRSDRAGVILGSGTAGLHSTIGHMHALATVGAAGVPALTFSNTVGNSAASLCAIEFGLRGPNVTFAQKQASSLAAMAFAVTALRDGRADAFVTGGVDDFEERFFRVHDRFGVMSETSRPFGRSRNGYVLGAGGHLVVLERADTAVARGATIVAEVLGVGRAGVACGVNQWPVSPDGLIRSMRAALAEASLAPSAVDVVFAAANSTKPLDRTEAAALEALFGPGGVPVVALKGAVGEFGASGSAALSAAVSCLRGNVLPPSLGADDLDPECRVRLSASPQPFTGRVALVNASAAGGSHYSLLVRALGPGEFEQRA